MMLGKDFRKLICKLLLLIVPFFFIIPISMIIWPFKFFDGEYSWYKENHDFAYSNREYVRVLVLGDSVAKAAYLPSILSDDTYNYALGGITPAEEYYYLREYLNNHNAPEYVFYTMFPVGFSDLETLWNRSVYFHRMSLADLEDLIRVSKGFSEEKRLKGEKTDIYLYYLYYIYSPNKYYTAFFKGLTSLDRYPENIQKYNAVIENKGQTQFGTNISSNGANRCTQQKRFDVSATVDYYFKKTIQLCNDYSIQFIYLNAPMNEYSLDSMDSDFLDGYTHYLDEIQQLYPGIIIEKDIPCYEATCFGDNNHVNIEGTRRFSNEIKKKYAYVFKE